MVGQTLAHYRILDKLGEGGMGVVYRAQDTKLGREVAIKVLPEAFAHDAERLARFQREAQLLASLNHPNIAAIYGLEEAGGLRYLVLELVPGQTLAELVGAGFKPAPTPLPLEEALGICKQVAEAFEAAHEKAIIHRDLKPANVKVTPEGKVKVLDFGLAKAFEGEALAADVSKSPTLSIAATRAGVILGTAAYMSPEQARGKPVDRRTDVWSFGCLLYEGLTGRKAFGGETITDNLAKILEREPDWNALPETTPASIRVLLRKCLQKDPNRRLHDISDARIEIEDAMSATTTALPAREAPRAARPAQAILWGVAGLALGALLAGLAVWRLTRTAPPAPPAPTRLTIALPATAPMALGLKSSVALSPDGTRLVYAARRSGGTQLYLRAMDELEPKPIAGTEGGEGPFFSPDGQWIGFFAEGKLKKVSISGGATLTLCDAPESRGASWSAHNTIFFTRVPISGVFKVSAAGGTPEAVTTLDRKKSEVGHRWPHVLPGDKAMLFTSVTPGGAQNWRVEVHSLETGQRRVLLEGAALARYVPSGHLVFVRGNGLLAVPFDLHRLEVTGSPVSILEGVMTGTTPGLAHFSFSDNGWLLYAPGGLSEASRQLVWVDPKRAARPLTATRRAYADPRLSPDGRLLAIVVVSPIPDVWVYAMQRDTLTRLTFEAGNYAPVWTPDGKRLAFSSTRNGPLNLFWKPADGSGSEERLTTSETGHFPSSFSPDGRALAFHEVHPSNGFDLWVLPLEGDRKPRPFLRTPFNEFGAVFSPDGRWLAYASNESGRNEVYVQPFPGPGGKWQVSTEGGIWPAWPRKGDELFYQNSDKMMAVSVSTQPVFLAGKPRLLFEMQAEGSPWPARPYDVAADGRGFVLVKGEQQAAPTQLNVVLNWFEDLKRRVPSTGREKDADSRK